MSDIDALKTELTTDPLGRGYAGMTDEQAAADLNTVYRDNPNPPEVVSAAAIWNALDATEYDGLNQTNQGVVDFIGGLGGDIPIASGLIKTKLFALFGAGTTSRNNLIALASGGQVSRGQELGVGKVSAGFVEEARR